MDDTRKERLEDLRWDAVKDIRGTQIKYIYYVIALNVAGVAFTMNQVKDDQFNCSHFLLLGSIILWSTGVYFGFEFLDKFKLVLHQTQNYLQFELESHKIDDAINKKYLNNFNSTTTKTQEAANKKYKMSLVFFYAGCIIYVIWQALQMIFFNSLNCNC